MNLLITNMILQHKYETMHRTCRFRWEAEAEKRGALPPHLCSHYTSARRVYLFSVVSFFERHVTHASGTRGAHFAFANAGTRSPGNRNNISSCSGIRFKHTPRSWLFPLPLTSRVIPLHPTWWLIQTDKFAWVLEISKKYQFIRRSNLLKSISTDFQRNSRANLYVTVQGENFRKFLQLVHVYMKF